MREQPAPDPGDHAPPGPARPPPMPYLAPMTTATDVAIRPAETDADLEAWIEVRRLVSPNDAPPTMELLRSVERPERRLVLVEQDRRVVGNGLADRSQVTGSFVAPRILPEYRRRGIGTAVLRHLMEHLAGHGFTSIGGHADDDGAFAFATHHGFEQIDAQVEQVRTLGPDEPPPPPYPGVDFATIEARPELLQRAFALARQGFADMALRTGPAAISIDEWLGEEATLPGGSFVALEHGIIVGYAGLLAWSGEVTRAENGLTVVERGWRGRGLATALKRRQLAWAAAHGIRVVATWTQQANEAMQRVNAGLGYTTGSVSRTMRRPLP